MRPDGPRTPALYEAVVAHARTAPLRYAFRHRTFLWLVDLDRVPHPPLWLRPFARFDPRDHFGGTEPTIRAGLDRFLAAHGIDLGGGRVVMLAHARVFGHVFNPLTVHWCRDSAGEPVCAVAEVHNTYGERHCYLLRTDADGCARVPKEFYVSPFFPVDGEYLMRLPEPGDRLALTVRLRRRDAVPFTATLRGRRRPATACGLLALALRHPWSTAAVSLRIREQGVRLLLRRLPRFPRPRHSTQEGLS